jgi:hypothetical protein
VRPHALAQSRYPQSRSSSMARLQKRRAAHEEKGQFFDGPGGKMYYEVVGAGTGTSLITVNGGPGFDQFRFPVLVITGRYDMNVAPLVAYRIHQAIPGSGFAVFEKSSHLPFTEEPEAFGKTVEEFLQAK